MSRRRLRQVAALGVTAVVAVTAPAPVSPAGAAPPLPSSMTALGDSITRGYNANGWYVDAPKRSWSTGWHGDVNSHYLRIQARHPAITGHHYNDARSGAKVYDLPRQATAAVERRVDYVTILVGANDACTDTESQMTPVSTYRSRLNRAMNTLEEGLPQAKVLAVSVPNLKRLWRVGKDSWAARTAWNTYDICQSMLADPRSTAQADVDRRNRVRQRVEEYNAELAAECAQHAQCRDDGGAVFGYRFTRSQLSRWDYFHPNTSGQAELARVSNAAGYRW